jgi:hypothetical protein
VLVISNGMGMPCIDHIRYALCVAHLSALMLNYLHHHQCHASSIVPSRLVLIQPISQSLLVQRLSTPQLHFRAPIEPISTS